jgi:hypothetical protein
VMCVFRVHLEQMRTRERIKGTEHERNAGEGELLFEAAILAAYFNGLAVCARERPRGV